MLTLHPTGALPGALPVRRLSAMAWGRRGRIFSPSRAVRPKRPPRRRSAPIFHSRGPGSRRPGGRRGLWIALLSLAGALLLAYLIPAGIFYFRSQQLIAGFGPGGGGTGRGKAGPAGCSPGVVSGPGEPGAPVPHCRGRQPGTNCTGAERAAAWTGSGWLGRLSAQRGAAVPSLLGV